MASIGYLYVSGFPSIPLSFPKNLQASWTKVDPNSRCRLLLLLLFSFSLPSLLLSLPFLSRDKGFSVRGDAKLFPAMIESWKGFCWTPTANSFLSSRGSEFPSQRFVVLLATTKRSPLSRPFLAVDPPLLSLYLSLSLSLDNCFQWFPWKTGVRRVTVSGQRRW